MNEFGKFALPHFTSTVPEHEKERVDRIRLSRAIRTDDCGKGLTADREHPEWRVGEGDVTYFMERSNLLPSLVTLEVH